MQAHEACGTSSLPSAAELEPALSTTGAAVPAVQPAYAAGALPALAVPNWWARQRQGYQEDKSRYLETIATCFNFLSAPLWHRGDAHLAGGAQCGHLLWRRLLGRPVAYGLGHMRQEDRRPLQQQAEHQPWQTFIDHAKAGLSRLAGTMNPSR